MVLCSQELSQKKKKTNRTRKKDICPAGLIKCLWLSPVYRELVFMSAVFCVKQRAKCGETVYFLVEENIPFSRKNQHFTETREKTHSSPQQDQKEQCRERCWGCNTWPLAATRPWSTSPVSLKGWWCREKGRKALTRQLWRKDLEEKLCLFVSMDALGVRFHCKISKMCNRCSQMLGIV